MREGRPLHAGQDLNSGPPGTSSLYQTTCQCTGEEVLSSYCRRKCCKTHPINVCEHGEEASKRRREVLFLFGLLLTEAKSDCRRTAGESYRRLFSVGMHLPTRRRSFRIVEESVPIANLDTLECKVLFLFGLLRIEAKSYCRRAAGESYRRLFSVGMHLPTRLRRFRIAEESLPIANLDTLECKVLFLFGLLQTEAKSGCRRTAEGNVAKPG